MTFTQRLGLCDGPSEETPERLTDSIDSTHTDQGVWDSRVASCVFKVAF